MSAHQQVYYRACDGDPEEPVAFLGRADGFPEPTGQVWVMDMHGRRLRTHMKYLTVQGSHFVLVDTP